MGNPVFDRKRGVIKTVLRAKQYGFIEVTPKEEYFFHSTALQGIKFSELVAGDAVSFIPTTGKEGKLRAVGIRRLDVDTPGVANSSADSTVLPGDGAISPEAGEESQQGEGPVRKQEDVG